MSGIEEFEQLVLKAEKQLDDTIYIERNDSGKWRAIKAGPADEDLHGATLSSLVAKLKEWAKPKKPDTITITLSFDDTANLAFAPVTIPHFERMRDACKEAIKPYED